MITTNKLSGIVPNIKGGDPSQSISDLKGEVKVNQTSIEVLIKSLLSHAHQQNNSNEYLE